MPKIKNVSDAIDQATSKNTWPTVEPAADGRGVFVVLRHEGQSVGFHLVPVGTQAGGWSMVTFAIQALDATVSMTSRTIRALPIGGLLTEARRAAGNRADRSAAKAFVKLARPSDARLAAFLADRRGGTERTDKDYAGLALEYALLLDAGERTPVKALAARFGGMAGTWGNRIAEARRRGVLTPSKSGQAGGGLTEKALRLLGWSEGENQV
ncbi:hypothetical protein ACFFX1_31355 [Dactylosporangium sucinum]|uniref:Uncharacterized protein n=1 Tax=Dactylosporangium sucinum TaxID=1424081 RepID=A0A917TVH2_9ACTN|nr:hypothetical protein [Dactylosporangium sucinum]GGM39975.1 hypothetical protein GCM10007977_046690 [Dactylosporangium sucinum]